MKSIIEELFSIKAILGIITGILVGVMVELRPDIVYTLKQRIRKNTGGQTVNEGESEKVSNSIFLGVLLLAIGVCVYLILFFKNASVIQLSNLKNEITYGLYFLLLLLIINFFIHAPFISISKSLTGPLKSSLVALHSLVLTLIFILVMKELFVTYVFSKNFTVHGPASFSSIQYLFIISFLALNVAVLTDRRFSFVRDFGIKYLSVAMLCFFTAFVIYLPAKQPVSKGAVINKFFSNDKLLNSFYDSLQVR